MSSLILEKIRKASVNTRAVGKHFKEVLLWMCCSEELRFGEVLAGGACINSCFLIFSTEDDNLVIEIQACKLQTAININFLFAYFHTFQTNII